MKDGTCPKCHGTEIHLDTRQHARNLLFPGLTILSSVHLENYICGTCGYLESYLTNPTENAKRWPRLDPPAPQSPQP
ncbi:MAG TPA: hypothetical protein VHM90_01535 [Phycisphaerae bacterium]|jgi:hypothetical protein|nr:hypothetical protein [Phycisphaerae bacterium]